MNELTHSEKKTWKRGRKERGTKKKKLFMSQEGVETRGASVLTVIVMILKGHPSTKRGAKNDEYSAINAAGGGTSTDEIHEGEKKRKSNGDPL